MGNGQCRENVSPGAAGADERHGYALGRYGSHYHCEVQAEAQSKHDGETVCGETILQIILCQCDFKPAPEEKPNDCEYCQYTDKA
ncbi:hypothetical protein ADUPG1_002169, partial [Aduncisulcus paluster]